MLPMAVILLLGTWELGRMSEVQQILNNAVREVAARQASAGQMTNSQVQSVVTNYVNNAGLPTTNVVVTVQDLTSPGTDVSVASQSDQLQVTVSILFTDALVGARRSWSRTARRNSPHKPCGPRHACNRILRTSLCRRLIETSRMCNRVTHNLPSSERRLRERPRGRLRKLSRSQRRAGRVVETALVLNICLMAILGMFDFGRLIMIRQLIDNAAREGCRLATVSTTTLTTQNIQTQVTNFLAGQQLGTVTIQVYEADPTSGANVGAWTSAGLGDPIAVQVSCTYTPMTPTFSLLPSSVPINTKCVMYCEAN